MEGAICRRASAGLDGPLKGVFASFSNSQRSVHDANRFKPASRNIGTREGLL
jgi:hypothetical protein